MTEFGDFTIRVKVNGADQNIRVANFDHDGSGTLSQAELNEILAQYGDQLDTFQTETLTAMVADDGEITSAELEKFEQERLINDKLESFKSTISQEFVGDNSSYQAYIMRGLKTYTKNFINTYVGNMSEMYTKYCEEIDAEYARIKAEILGSDTVDDAVEKVVADILDRHPSIDEASHTRIFNALLEKANEYVAANPNATDRDIQDFLERYLESTLGGSDFQNEIAAWEDAVSDTQSYGYTTQELLTQLIPNALDLIDAAYAKGIAFKLDGSMKSLAQMEAYVEGFTDGQALVNFMSTLVTAINRASNVTMEAMLVQGSGQYVIEVNSATGTATGMSNFDPEIVDEIVENVVDSIVIRLLDDLNPEVRISFGDRLTAEALKFISANYFETEENLERDLLEHLLDFIRNPLAEIKGSVDGWQADLDGINLGGNPSQRDLEKLLNLLETVWHAAEAAGIKFQDIDGAPLDLETIKSGYDRINANELKQLIQNIINEIKNNDKRLDQVYRENGTGEITITLSGTNTVDAQYLRLLNAIIDRLINTLKDKTHATAIGQRLKEAALAHMCETEYASPEDFNSEMAQYLSDYMESPMKALLSSLPALPNGDDYEYCEPEELQQLKNIFTELLQKANAAHVQFVDQSGNAITTSILSQYNTGNAHDLWVIVNNMIKGVKGLSNMNIEKLFAQYPDGVVKLIVTETGVYTEEQLDESIDDLDYGNVSEDINTISIKDLRKQIADNIKKQLENKAKRICKRLGIDWESIGKKNFDNAYKSAEFNAFGVSSSWFGEIILNVGSVTGVPKNIAEKIASKTMSIFSNWAHRTSGK